MQIEIDSDELDALIEFQRQMREDALDSCEYEEAAQRKERWEQLRKIRRARP